MKYFLWRLRSSHMKTIGLTEYTRVSPFLTYPIHAIQILFLQYAEIVK